MNSVGLKYFTSEGVVNREMTETQLFQNGRIIKKWNMSEMKFLWNIYHLGDRCNWCKSKRGLTFFIVRLVHKRAILEDVKIALRNMKSILFHGFGQLSDRKYYEVAGYNVVHWTLWTVKEFYFLFFGKKISEGPQICMSIRIVIF